MVSLITQILLLLLGFGTRTVFIHLLSAEYLGLDGLFASILTIFSLAELGIGNALTFSMYKPIATGDIEKAQQLLTLYDKAYRWIITFIIIVGLVLLPFLPKIVNADLDHLVVNVYVVYLLFLFNTISSYFLAYRQAVLAVNQYQSTITWYQTLGKIVVYSLECVLLLAFCSYYLYLTVRVAGNYIIAIMISKKAKKEYPILCEKNDKPLERTEIKRIKNDIYGLFIRRVGSVVMGSADNIIINSFISLAMVGIYSNYLLIVSSLQSITSQFFSAMTATIGNFMAVESKDKSEDAFRLYTFMVFVVYGVCTICCIMLVNRFIELLWGSNYVLSKLALYLIIINFYFWGFQSAINVFRDTAGLFVQGKYRYLYSTALNVALSLLLVQRMGIEGIILGTIISRLLISVWYDPYILYKISFKCRPTRYYGRFTIYFCLVVGFAFLFDKVTSSIPHTISGFIVCLMIGLLVPFTLTIPLIRTAEAKELHTRIKYFIKEFERTH